MASQHGHPPIAPWRGSEVEGLGSGKKHCPEAGGSGRTRARKQQEEAAVTQTPSLSPELLLPPTQSARTLCAPVVSQPGVLGPVPLPTAEQVSWVRAASSWEGRVSELRLTHPRPSTSPQAAQTDTRSLGGLLTSAISSGYASPARRSLHTRCLTMWSLPSSSSTASPLPWRGRTLTQAAP